jgi:hypothetical protein
LRNKRIDALISRAWHYNGLEKERIDALISRAWHYNGLGMERIDALISVGVGRPWHYD